MRSPSMVTNLSFTRAMRSALMLLFLSYLGSSYHPPTRSAYALRASSDRPPHEGEVNQDCVSLTKAHSSVMSIQLPSGSLICHLPVACFSKKPRRTSDSALPPKGTGARYGFIPATAATWALNVSMFSTWKPMWSGPGRLIDLPSVTGMDLG